MIKTRKKMGEYDQGTLQVRILMNDKYGNPTDEPLLVKLKWSQDIEDAVLDALKERNEN